MSWRTVVISSRCKLDLKMGYMVVRTEETRRILIKEIATVVIENPAVSMTGMLLNALIDNKVKVILCDDKRTPSAELVPYYGCHDTSRKIELQIGWRDEVKGAVWGLIVAEKIRNQAKFLKALGHDREYELLTSYLGQLKFQDASNREAHAAKVYFNAVFGMEFSRSAESCWNAALDYGYSILLSAFNREVAACGYLTQFGLHHSNVFNRFNLSSDLMEPFRPLVDREVVDAAPTIFDKEIKRRLVDLTNREVAIAGAKQTLLNAISIYCRSVFNSLNNGDETPKIVSYEF